MPTPRSTWHSLADVVRQHRYEHARTLLETACQEAAQLRDYFPVIEALFVSTDVRQQKTPESSR